MIQADVVSGIKKALFWSYIRPWTRDSKSSLGYNNWASTRDNCETSVYILITTESRAKICHQLNACKPPMAKAVVCSKVLVLLLLIHCFMFLTLFVGVLCWSLFSYAFICDLSSFVIILTRKRELVALL